MNELITAAAIFCSHITTMTTRQECFYDFLSCAWQQEIEWEYIHEQPKYHHMLTRENSHRIQGMANCVLIDMGDK